MDSQTFEALVAQAIDQLPAEFLHKLNNVEVVIEPWPSLAHLRAVKAHPQTLLLGLYQGVPQTKRNLSTFMPDKITIFSGPILTIARCEADIPKIISDVVKHEIAHHFGMSEEALHQKGR